jgi:hypothetical protein
MSLDHILLGSFPLKMTRKKSYHIRVKQISFTQKILNLPYIYVRTLIILEAKFYFFACQLSTLLRMNLDGRACVLRAICEAAETTISDSGLAGEVLHLLLT